MIKLDHNLGWTFNAPTITEMMAGAIRGQLDCIAPDATLNIETHLFNTTLQAASCRYDLDIGKDVWLNIGRWSRLIKEYVPRVNLDRFTENAADILAGRARDGATCNFVFHDPARYAKKHRWGGCLMGATFRGDNRRAGRATLTFYSRTTYIGYMGLLDAGIAAVMAKQIAKRANTINPNGAFASVDDISFRWHISSQQLHCFKTLPYIYSQPDLMKRLERYARNPRVADKSPPAWRHISKWYAKVLEGWRAYSMSSHDDPSETLVQQWLLTEKYGPFRRIKRRWCEYKKLLNKHVPPSLPIKRLNFDKAI